jgi:hypothetical protein
MDAPEIGTENWRVSTMALKNENFYINTGPELFQ